MRDDTVISVLAERRAASALTSTTSVLNKGRAGVVPFHKLCREKLPGADSSSAAPELCLSRPRFLLTSAGTARHSSSPVSMPGRTTSCTVETQEADIVSMVTARLGGDIFISAHITSSEVCEQAVRFCKR